MLVVPNQNLPLFFNRVLPHSWTCFLLWLVIVLMDKKKLIAWIEKKENESSVVNWSVSRKG